MKLTPQVGKRYWITFKGHIYYVRCEAVAPGGAEAIYTNLYGWGNITHMQTGTANLIAECPPNWRERFWLWLWGNRETDYGLEHYLQLKRPRAGKVSDGRN
jgi:hypothetical protein